jgi:hypothetical protein
MSGPARAFDHVDSVACRKLWRAVLLDQLRFALAERGPSKSGRVAPEIARARAWFLTEDARLVCALAGVDVDWLLPRVARELSRPLRERAIVGVDFRSVTFARGAGAGSAQAVAA